MSQPSLFRKAAKRIPPLYWLVGLGRYLRFRSRLGRERDAYQRRANSTIPPPMLRFRVHGALDEASYVEAGRVIGSQIVEVLNRHGAGLEDSRVLDFACGPGRIAVEVKKWAASCRLHGSDIDPEAIEWANRHLREVGVFSVNPSLPPTAYHDAYFDISYTVSLFTHLDEEAQNAWLAELARLVKPGGWLLATVHGRLARSSCTRDEDERLGERGIAYRMDRTGRFKLDGLPDSYQTTFHTREYVERKWTRWFDLVEYVEGGLGQHQDLVVLRRPLIDRKPGADPVEKIADA